MRVRGTPRLHRAPERPDVLGERLSQRTVRTHDLANVAPHRAKLGARRDSRPLEAREDPAPEVGEIRVLGRAHHEPRGGAIGNDVRRLSAICDDPVDTRVAADQEAERRHRVPAQHETVQRVHTVLRLGGRVRRLPQELDVESDHREHERVDLIPVAGVVHEGGVHPLERSAFQESDLAIAALLRGAADHADAPTHSIKRVAEREEGSDRRRSHEVVPAAVTDPRQRVVLAKDRDDRTAGADLGDERRLEASGRTLDGDLLRLEVIRERARREALFECELGPCVDLEREPVERLRARVDALGNPLLPRRGVQVALRLTRTRGGRRRAEDELREDEPSDDESACNQAQAIDRAQEAERRDESADLDASANGASTIRAPTTRARERGVALFDGHADEGDRACEGDGRSDNNRGDRERVGRIAAQDQEDHGGERRHGTESEQRLRQRSSVSPCGSMRSGSATCSLPAAIGACASVSIALEARDSARSVSSNFFVAFSR